jgi:hypothetical protein
MLDGTGARDHVQYSYRSRGAGDICRERTVEIGFTRRIHETRRSKEMKNLNHARVRGHEEIACAFDYDWVCAHNPPHPIEFGIRLSTADASFHERRGEHELADVRLGVRASYTALSAWAVPISRWHQRW